jgi:hypothetical protein
MVISALPSFALPSKHTHRQPQLPKGFSKDSWVRASQFAASPSGYPSSSSVRASQFAASAVSAASAASLASSPVS